MNVMVVGGGGREHALAAAIDWSPLCSKLYCLPGNPGMAKLRKCKCLVLPNSNQNYIVSAAQRLKIDLVVIGPEGYLAAGLADRLRLNGVPVFGPSAAAAMIESSKVWARRLMTRKGVRQPAYRVCSTVEEVRVAIQEIQLWSGQPGVVIKANGLAGGKGAVVCHDEQSGMAAAYAMLVEQKFGPAGAVILVEELVGGVGSQEVSLFVLTDGYIAIPLLPAQDYKRLGDGDQGPNTGGMGAHCPAPIMTQQLVERAMQEIVHPVLQGMAEGGTPFQGCLYLGLMVIPGQPPELPVIEYNCRFGDPETQVVLPLLDQDLLPLMWAVAHGRLEEQQLCWKDACAVTVVMASGGYPGPYEAGLPVNGIREAEAIEGVTVYQAGTGMTDGQLRTTSGRVLSATGVGPDHQEAVRRAYWGVEQLDFPGKTYRRDIGARFRS